jgi:hypothetical protein
MVTSTQVGLSKLNGCWTVILFAFVLYYLLHSTQLCIYLITYNIIILPSFDVEANDNSNQMIRNLLKDYPKL